ncbi:hypothetical protein LEP1GSC007_3241 [Leptospira interrogans serovar Bulgarica str. Mallika]|nr:hypothetical protein LEP1GSC007_3241 [Leptospira interrogans serovar Bulgarica str. Mallika]
MLFLLPNLENVKAKNFKENFYFLYAVKLKLNLRFFLKSNIYFTSLIENLF